MNPRTLIGCLAILLAPVVVRGGYSFDVNAAIPDGNPVGITSVGLVSGLPGGAVSGLSVSLNVSGGYNGDLYAYLVSPNGTRVTLFNQPGVTESDPFGYGGSGMNLTLADAAAGSMQNTAETPGAALTGTYRPLVSLSAFNGPAGNGAWTLFMADESRGGGQATLNSWNLSYSTVAVPEADQVAAMALLVVLAFAFKATRWAYGAKSS